MSDWQTFKRIQILSVGRVCRNGHSHILLVGMEIFLASEKQFRNSYQYNFPIYDTKFQTH